MSITKVARFTTYPAWKQVLAEIYRLITDAFLATFTAPLPTFKQLLLETPACS